MNRADVYARVTQGILERLAAGVAPWHKPWAVASGRPRNFASGRAYNGVNALALGLMGRSPYWLTFQQVKRLGLWLRKGSKGVPILFVKTDTKTERGLDGQDVVREVAVVRCYHVFNAEDVEGLKLPDVGLRNDGVGVAKAEALLGGVRPAPRIVEGTAAAYASDVDVITLPPRASFDSMADYYSTAFHELTHWTGHSSRLNRATLVQAVPFGSPVYSQEELVAEMGAGFLCALAGIENRTIKQNAAYLGHWLNVLKGEPGMIIRAAAQAQRAADYLAPHAEDDETEVEVAA